jgi:hypothetical protein
LITHPFVGLANLYFMLDWVEDDNLHPKELTLRRPPRQHHQEMPRTKVMRIRTRSVKSEEPTTGRLAQAPTIGFARLGSMTLKWRDQRGHGDCGRVEQVEFTRLESDLYFTAQCRESERTFDLTN